MDGGAGVRGGRWGVGGWWPGDGNANEIDGGNNGVLGNEVGFAQGEDGQGFNFTGESFKSPGSIITVPATGGLDLPTVTMEAWVFINLPPPSLPDPGSAGLGAIDDPPAAIYDAALPVLDQVSNNEAPDHASSGLAHTTGTTFIGCHPP